MAVGYLPLLIPRDFRSHRLSQTLLTCLVQVRKQRFLIRSAIMVSMNLAQGLMYQNNINWTIKIPPPLNAQHSQQTFPKWARFWRHDYNTKVFAYCGRIWVIIERLKAPFTPGRSNWTALTGWLRIYIGKWMLTVYVDSVTSGAE